MKTPLYWKCKAQPQKSVCGFTESCIRVNSPLVLRWWFSPKGDHACAVKQLTFTKQVKMKTACAVIHLSWIFQNVISCQLCNKQHVFPQAVLDPVEFKEVSKLVRATQTDNMHDYPQFLPTGNFVFILFSGLYKRLITWYRNHVMSGPSMHYHFYFNVVEIQLASFYFLNPKGFCRDRSEFRHIW